jgi:hypothetical protein
MNQHSALDRADGVKGKGDLPAAFVQSLLDTCCRLLSEQLANAMFTAQRGRQNCPISRDARLAFLYRQTALASKH